MDPDLPVVCLSAFVAVFVLLSGLAVVMRALISLFPPEPEGGADAAVIAAVTSTVAAAFPGTKVTKIEESR